MSTREVQSHLRVPAPSHPFPRDRDGCDMDEISIYVLKSPIPTMTS